MLLHIHRYRHKHTLEKHIINYYDIHITTQQPLAHPLSIHFNSASRTVSDRDLLCVQNIINV